MLYSEFLQGTGGADTEKNRDLYKHVEAIYMATDMTKADAYRMVKHHVDTETEEQKTIRQQMLERIERKEDDVAYLEYQIDYYKTFLKDETDEKFAKLWRTNIKAYRDLLKRTKAEIAELKWVIQ